MDQTGNIQKYKIFLAVADLGSFNAAAIELGYTQAGISYAINSLEKEIGLSLFLRTYNGVTMTSEGRALYPLIQNLCSEDRHLNNVINDLKHVETGSLSISAFTSVYANWVPYILKRFKARYPNIDVQVRCCDDFETINNMIRSGELDCAFTTLPEPIELETIHLCSDPLLAVLPEDHLLAGEKTFPMHCLGEYPYVVPGGSFDEIDEIFQHYHIQPIIAFRSESDYATLSYVRAGLGFTLYPKLFLNDSMDGLVTKELEIPQFREIVLAYRSKKSLTSATARFLEIAQQWYQDNSGRE